MTDTQCPEHEQQPSQRSSVVKRAMDEALFPLLEHFPTRDRRVRVYASRSLDVWEIQVHETSGDARLVTSIVGETVHGLRKTTCAVVEECRSGQSNEGQSDDARRATL